MHKLRSCTLERFFLLTGMLTLTGCGAVSDTSSEPQATQPTRDYRTQIEAGIYVGEVECEFTSRNSQQGVVDSYTYDFTETFSFGSSGNPDPGVAYNPENDQLEFFGTVFDVTNRTYATTETRCVENAYLAGEIDGERINGLITWTFTKIDADSIQYQLQIAWTYRSGGVPWNDNEECGGTLTR